MRYYGYSNYSEWKIKALEECRDIYQDILDYDDEASDDFRRGLKIDRGNLKEWLKELRKNKKDINKDPGVVKWKIKILNEIKGNLELNLKGNEGYTDEEINEIYEEELEYVKRWLNELKL